MEKRTGESDAASDVDDPVTPVDHLLQSSHLSCHFAESAVEFAILHLDVVDPTTEPDVLILEISLFVLESLHFFPLAFARGLSGGPITKNLSRYDVCSFSASVLARFLLKTNQHMHYVSFTLRKSRRAYRGGKFVVGVGSSCPHDFRFFTGFFSESSEVPVSSSSFIEAGGGKSSVCGRDRFILAEETVEVFGGGEEGFGGGEFGIDHGCYVESSSYR